MKKGVIFADASKMWPLESGGTRWVSCFELWTRCLLQQTPLFSSPHQEHHDHQHLEGTLLTGWYDGPPKQSETRIHPVSPLLAPRCSPAHLYYKPTFLDSAAQYPSNFHSVSPEIHPITRECALKWCTSSNILDKNSKYCKKLFSYLVFFLVGYDRPHSSVNRVIAVINVLLQWA